MISTPHDIRPEALLPDLSVGHFTAAGVKALRVGAGPTLLLLHGGTGSWTHWVRNIGPLSRRFSLMVPDLPGMGESLDVPRDTGLDSEALQEFKKRLKEGERSVRAVLGDAPALTSVQVDKNKLIEKGGELLLIVGQGALRIAKTVAVQAYEDFSARDFGRPAHDAKSGMLPPKLARMMVNLSGAPKDEPLLDAFCGSGTILTEAADLGYRQLVGSDISEKAVADTKTNCAWIVRERNFQGVNLNVFTSDVKDLPSKLPDGAVSAIVSGG